MNTQAREKPDYAFVLFSRWHCRSRTVFNVMPPCTISGLRGCTDPWLLSSIEQPVWKLKAQRLHFTNKTSVSAFPNITTHLLCLFYCLISVRLLVSPSVEAAVLWDKRHLIHNTRDACRRSGQRARHPSKPGQFPICMHINYSIHAASLLGLQLCGRHEDGGERDRECLS